MRRLPSIPSSSLRDHGAPERLERIWKRIQPDLAAGPRSLARPAALFWTPAALAMVFAAGIFVGAKWVRPERVPALTAERPVVPERAAGHAAPAAELVPAPSAERPLPRTPRGRSSDLADAVSIIVPSEPEAPAPVVQLAPVGPPEWERLADLGDFEAARSALETRGGFGAVLGAASASQLMTLVDVARASGSREHAVLALRRIVEAYPAEPEAPLAAWTLGTLLEQAGDRAGAAVAFALYRRLSPGGDFAEDALAREVDSAFSQGNLELSARLVAQYENEFPSGPRLEEFRGELAKRSAGGAAPVPAASGAASRADPARSESSAAPEGASSKPPSK